MLFDAVAQIAGRQHGRISHAQMLAAGIDRDRIKRWRADGRLDPCTAGCTPSATARRLRSPISWQPCSHAATAPARATARCCTLAGSSRRPPPKPEVSVPSPGGRAPAGHRGASTRVVPAGRHDTFEAIAMTTVPRALLDVAPSLDAFRAVPGVPRGMGPLSRDASADRGVHRTQPGEAGSREAAAGVRRGRDAQRAREGFPRACSITRPAAPAHEHRRGGQQGRLPLAAVRPDHRAAQLPLSRQPLGFETDNTRRRRSRHLPFTWGDVFERGDADRRRVARAPRDEPTR